MSVGNHVPKVTQRNALAIQLRKSLSDPGNPLHRWNSLPESFRPLLFSLRTQVLHLLPLLDWSRVDSKPDVDFGDFDAIELADQPWNMAWQDISSNHRIHFTVAASRGVLHGQKHMKTVSSMILSLCLARGKSSRACIVPLQPLKSFAAAHTAIDTGRVSEWVGFTNAETKQDEIGKLVSTYLERLYGTTGTQNRYFYDIIIHLVFKSVRLGRYGDRCAGCLPSSPFVVSDCRRLALHRHPADA